MSKRPRRPEAPPATKAEALARLAKLERRVRSLERELARRAREANTARRENTGARQDLLEAREQQAAAADILQAVIAIENVRLFRELDARNHDLAESLERQTATADILRAISQAQTDPQPVFEAIVDSAMRLFGAWTSTVYRYDGELVSMVAARGGSFGSANAVKEQFQPPHRPTFPPEVVVLTGMVGHVIDVDTDPSCDSAFRRIAASRGFRSFVAVPMLRGTDPLGLITVGRTQPGAFSQAEVALLQTFADQAVIAVENARLLAELQARNTDLTESLEQQTATAEILRVISESQTDVQPVFDTIVRNAVRLCGATHGGVYRFDGQLVHSMAHDGYTPQQLAQWRATWPRPVTAPNPACQAIRTRRALRVADIETATALAGLNADTRANLRARGSRSSLAVPMFRRDEVIGAIVLTQRVVDAFSEAHEELLRTFADQAVIAIENVRLFNETKEALERQTATADILKVISSSPTNVQPVFDAIAESAFRLLSCAVAGVLRRAGDGFSLAAMHSGNQDVGLPPNPEYVPIDPAANFPSRVFVSKTMLHIPDWTAIELPVHERGVYEQMGVRSSLMLPLLQEGDCIGVLFVARARRERTVRMRCSPRCGGWWALASGDD